MNEQTTASASAEAPASKRSNRKRNALVFGAVALVWLALDVLTKGWVAGNYVQGEVITEPILGLVRFHLVHNTGAAWGMFGDSTFLLGVMSLVVCAALVVYLFALSPKAGVIETVGIALVVAGGLGNVLDRFTLGYVVDFIEPTFIDFPVFNVADIGVTCGFVIFLIGVVTLWRREDRAAADMPRAPSARG
ncbi:signal peptidase II, partial [Eggerthella sinensis]|uniref:signal peptidase II n=1 Tax=Eggerthella sinensis TaxID=242230 RepID=UPI0022E1726E